MLLSIVIFRRKDSDLKSIYMIEILMNKFRAFVSVKYKITDPLICSTFNHKSFVYQSIRAANKKI